MASLGKTLACIQAHRHAIIVYTQAGRERERDGEKKVCVRVCVYIYVYIYIYTFIYLFIHKQMY